MTAIMIICILVVGTIVMALPAACQWDSSSSSSSGASTPAPTPPGSQCGGPCYANNDCVSIECSRCDITNQTTQEGVCVKGLPCFSQCNVTTDCDQVSNCTLCNAGYCGRGCGQSCNSTKDCFGYNCNECVQGSCVLWRCGVYCDGDAACAVGGFQGCAYCDEPKYGIPGVCKSTCGSLCNVDSECPSRCPFCDSGVCNVELSVSPVRRVAAP